MQADRFQVTPALKEFWIDSGVTATVTNIGSTTVYGAPDAMFPDTDHAAWSLAPGASRVEDSGAVWVRTALGTSSVLTVVPVVVDSGGGTTTTVAVDWAVANGCHFYVPAGADTSSLLNTANAATQSADNKLLLAGEIIFGGTSKVAVLKIDPATMKPDATFGAAGWWSALPVGSTGSLSQGICTQADGKILVAGYGSFGGLKATVSRLTTAGATDTTFGVNGHAIFNATACSATATYGVDVQADGKIVVSGAAIRISDGATVFHATRLNTDGSIDTSYGSSGSAVFDVSNFAHAAAWNVKIDSKGRANLGGQSQVQLATTTLVGNVAGQTTTVSGVPVAYIDVTSTAALVNNTGQDLKGSQIKVGPNAEAYSVTAILSATRLQIATVLTANHGAGDTVTATYSAQTCARLTTAGALDTTFNTTGYNTKVLGQSSAGLTISLQADGKAVTTGAGFINAPTFQQSITYARYNEDGTLDATLGQGLQYATPGWAYFVGSGSQASDIDANGKIVTGDIGGNAYCTRIHPSGMPDLSFGSRGSAPRPVPTTLPGWMTPNGLHIMTATGNIAVVGVGLGLNDVGRSFAAILLDPQGQVITNLSPTFTRTPPTVPTLPANGAVTNPAPPVAGTNSGSAAPRLAALTGDGATTQFTIWHGMGANPVRAKGFLSLGAGLFGPEAELNYGAAPADPVNATTIVFPVAPPSGTSYYLEFDL